MNPAQIKKTRAAKAQRVYAASKNPLAVKPATFVATGIYTGNNMQSSRAGAHDMPASLPMSAQIGVRAI